MATMNGSARGAMRTTNKSGHAAYKMADRERLVSMVLTTMFAEKKFYGDNTSELVKLAEDMCKSGQGEFVAKLAVWARTKGNMRAVSHALMAVVAHECGGQVGADGESLIRKGARSVAGMRGDDGTEMIATYLSMYGKPMSHALNRGIADALRRAKPYSIAKYQSASREVKLRDTLRITHPNPVHSDTSEAMGRCVAGELPVPTSWETELSARGNTKEVWDELISEGKVPFMASLRNMRNIIKAGADIEPILAKLSDPDAVHRSRQLPFRFYSAYRELEKAGLASTKISRALDKALMAACDNADRLPGRTAVLIDTSGSMGYAVSAKSTVTSRDIAAVLGAMAVHISDDALVLRFDTDASLLPMSGLSILGDIARVPASGGWTNMGAAFDCLMRTGFDADRIIVLSDNEVNCRPWLGVGFGESNPKTMQSKLLEYRRMVGHDVWCHAIDLQCYGTTQWIGPKIDYISGWSDQVLRFVSLTERGMGSLVDEIEGMSL